MKNAEMSQADMILMFMRENGSITPLDAIREFGCLRLGARIYDLRKRGYSISRKLDKSTNRYGKTVTYARYMIEEEAG